MMGINRNFPQAVAHGPPAYQGLNLPNLFTEQLIQHIQTLLKYGSHTFNVTGNLIQANAELLWLETGIGGPFFQIPELFQACVMPTWVSQCWVHCIQRGINISTDLPDLRPQWEQDKEFMHIFADGGFCKAELMILNHCWMYLQVIFLSDICEGSGSKIAQQYWSGKTLANIYSFNWPKMMKPTSREWNVWQQGLHLSLNLDPQQWLTLPLGKWIQDGSHKAGWYTGTIGEQLFWHDAHTWQSFIPIPACRQMCTFHSHPRALPTEVVPSNLEKATVYAKGTMLTITSHGPLQDSPLLPLHTPDDPFWESWNCQYWLEGNAQELQNAIRTGQAVAVSNGSFMSNAGTAAWTIEGGTAENWQGQLPRRLKAGHIYKTKIH